MRLVSPGPTYMGRDATGWVGKFSRLFPSLMPFSGLLELVAVVVTETLHGTLTAEDGGEVGSLAGAWCLSACMVESVEGVG